MYATSPYRFIAIEGNIGAGKSSLATKLASQLYAKLILEEFEDNSFLKKFYEDKRRYAFPLEMSFLAARFNQLKRQLTEPDLFSKHIVSDYIFSKCLLFSRVNLEEDEFDLYQKLFNIINPQLPQPDLLIYLHAPVEKLKWNIASRGRSFEMNIQDSYLQELQEVYFDYLNKNPQLRILVLDCSQIDFVTNTTDFTKITYLIEKEYEPGIHHIRF